MIYRDITYTDYNGNERTDRFYFNLSRAELLRMQFTENGEGLEKKLQNIIKSNNNELIWKTFEEIVYNAVGIKSVDGKQFDKSVNAKKQFTESEAYSEFLYMLMTGNYGKDPDYASKFISGLIDQEALNNTMKRIDAQNNLSLVN